MTKVDALTELGREIRRRRIALGMTLEELAGIVGLTTNFIGTVENGRRDPSVTTIQAIAKGLGIQPGDLFGGLGGLSAEGLEAARLFDRVAPRIRAAILVLLPRSRKRRRR